jgi:hypothetical protein
MLGGVPVFDDMRVPFKAFIDYLQGQITALEEGKAKPRLLHSMKVLVGRGARECSRPSSQNVATD